MLRHSSMHLRSWDLLPLVQLHVNVLAALAPHPCSSNGVVDGQLFAFPEAKAAAILCTDAAAACWCHILEVLLSRPFVDAIADAA